MEMKEIGAGGRGKSESVNVKYERDTKIICHSLIQICKQTFHEKDIFLRLMILIPIQRIISSCLLNDCHAVSAEEVHARRHLFVASCTNDQWGMYSYPLNI